MSRFFRGGSDSDSSSSSDDSSSDDDRKKRPANAFAALGGDSDSDDSDSDSSSSSSSSSSEDNDNDYSSDSSFDDSKDNDNKQTKTSGYSRFLAGNSDSDSDSDSDESDEDDRRIVKSSKDKKTDDMRQIIATIANARKIRDWVVIQSEFDKITKLYQKSQSTISVNGVPRFYVRFLVQLEDYIKLEQNNKVELKKLNGLSSRAFNAIKQTLRKYIRNFEDDMNRFRKNPVNALDSANEADDESDESDNEDKKEQKEDGFQTIGKGGKVFKPKTETLFKQVQEIIEARGRKATDKSAQINNLEALLDVAKTPYQKIKIYTALIPAQLDATVTLTNSISSVIPEEIWKSAIDNVIELFNILENTKSISLVNKDINLPDDEVIDTQINENIKTELRIPLLSYIDRLDDEFNNSLQNIDPHTVEYVTRLKEETFLYAFLVKSQSFFENLLIIKQAESNSTDNLESSNIKQSGSIESLNEIEEYQGSNEIETLSIYIQLLKMRRLERLYYKPDNVIKALDEQLKTSRFEYLKLKLEDSNTLVESLCISLYPSKIDRIRARALLCHVYHMALHDDYRRARDTVLMSHTQDTIQKTDISTQILFNRTMVQIGFCAFRNGMIRESMYALQDIYSNEKMKELLAQGVQSSKFADKNLEQERLALKRQLPFHMHINLELLECIYLTSSMLLELPNMARYQHDLRKKIISKPFRKHYLSTINKVFTGPPENTRERIMAAAQFISKGEWKNAIEMINAIKIWDLMVNADKVKLLLAEKIKEESLRTYIFSFAVPYYDSLSLNLLSEMFDLSVIKVHTILSRMIIKEEIQAKLSKKTDTIVFYGVGQSRTHYLAENLAEKISNLVDSNEKWQEAIQQALVQAGLDDNNLENIDNTGRQYNNRKNNHKHNNNNNHSHKHHHHKNKDRKDTKDNKENKDIKQNVNRKQNIIPLTSIPNK